jgi:hypothetical protein
MTQTQASDIGVLAQRIVDHDSFVIIPHLTVPNKEISSIDGNNIPSDRGNMRARFAHCSSDSSGLVFVDVYTDNHTYSRLISEIEGSGRSLSPTDLTCRTPVEFDRFTSPTIKAPIGDSYLDEVLSDLYPR